MEAVCILKNPWIENAQFFGNDWLNIAIAGKRTRLWWHIFPSNDAAVVFDGSGHPLAYFNRSAREGVSPVEGFNGRLPSYFDGINYIEEELKLVGSQLELLLSWPGWDCEDLFRALENPENRLSESQLKNLALFFSFVYMDSPHMHEASPAFNIQI